MNKLFMIFTSVFVFYRFIYADEANAVLPIDEHYLIERDKFHLQIGPAKSKKERIRILESNAEMFMSENKYSFALDIYNEILNNKASRNKKFKYYVLIGDIYNLQRKYDFSLECYKQALNLYKKNIEVKLKIGDVFLKGNLYNLAEISFSEVLSIDKKSGSAKRDLGDVFYYQGINTKAVYYYRQINPKNYDDETVIRIISCYRNVGMLDEAIKILDELKGNENSELSFLYGLLFMDKKEYSTAEDIFLKVIESDKKSFKSYMYLALVYSLTGKIQKSAKMFDKAYSMNPSYAVIDLMRAELSYKMKKFDEAKKYAKNAYRKANTDFIKNQAQKTIDFLNDK